MTDKHKLQSPLRAELAEAKVMQLLDPKVRKKKLIIWVIRFILTIVIYIYFWHVSWLKWTLFLMVPLTLFNLFMITVFPLKMQKRMEAIGKEKP